MEGIQQAGRQLVVNKAFLRSLCRLNSFRFGTIKRLFKGNNPGEIGQFAHIQWFHHATRSDLQELAQMNEVFETYDCTGTEAVPLELLEVLNGDLLEKLDVPGARRQDGYRPVTVRYLQPGEPPPPYDPTHPERLFCRYAGYILVVITPVQYLNI